MPAASAFSTNSAILGSVGTNKFYNMGKARCQGVLSRSTGNPGERSGRICSFTFGRSKYARVVATRRGFEDVNHEGRAADLFFTRYWPFARNDPNS
jgi:hypothetical protein